MIDKLIENPLLPKGIKLSGAHFICIQLKSNFNFRYFDAFVASANGGET
jgi:hypothetical protein